MLWTCQCDLWSYARFGYVSTWMGDRLSFLTKVLDFFCRFPWLGTVSYLLSCRLVKLCGKCGEYHSHCFCLGSPHILLNGSRSPLFKCDFGVLGSNFDDWSPWRPVETYWDLGLYNCYMSLWKSSSGDLGLQSDHMSIVETWRPKKTQDHELKKSQDLLIFFR